MGKTSISHRFIFEYYTNYSRFMNKNYLSILSGLLLSSGALAQMSQKTVFTDNFPKIVSFRGEYAKPYNDSYAQWEDGNLPSDGVIKKYGNWDEMHKVNLLTQEWAETFQENYPEALMQLHWNMRSHRNDQPGSSDRYFPGHWLSFPGSHLSVSISNTSTSIVVDDLTPFNRISKNTGTFKNPVLLLVELDAQGNRLWDNYEFIEMTEINESDNTILVKRAQALSTARSFAKGVYVAPMCTRLSNPGLFDYNWSNLCPKDANGKQASDIVLDELKDLMLNGGDLQHLNGICFDVLQWHPRESTVDTNNDGIADGGIINGVNHFREGALTMQEEIRAALGDECILTSDSYETINQRATHLFNGMESEGLVAHNDAFRGIAKTINIYSFWEEFCTAGNRFNYIVSKINNQIDISNTDNYRRLCLGTATCLGVSMTRPVNLEPFDEQMAGSEQTVNWLGAPVGDMLRLAKQQPDLINNKGIEFPSDFINNITSNNCNISKQNGLIKVVGNSNDATKNMSITFNNLDFGEAGKDAVMYFEIKSNGSSSIPRIVYAEAGNLPELENTSKENDMYNELWGYYTNSDYALISLYYRQAGGLQNITLTFEGQDDVNIRQITIHQSPQLLAREFENGIVLVNPSLNTQTFNLNELFPGNTFRKLKGFSHPVYNDGSSIENTVEVAATNALFIHKEASPTSIDNANESNAAQLIYNPLNQSCKVTNIESPFMLSVYDISGKLLERHQNIQSEESVAIKTSTKGLYIINIQNTDHNHSQKITL